MFESEQIILYPEQEPEQNILYQEQEPEQNILYPEQKPKHPEQNFTDLGVYSRISIGEKEFK